MNVYVRRDQKTERDREREGKNDEPEWRLVITMKMITGYNSYYAHHTATPQSL